MTQKQLRDLNTIVETYGSDKQEDSKSVRNSSKPF